MTPSLVVIAAAGGLFGVGIVLMVRGALGVAVPLEQVVTELHRPRTTPTAPVSRGERWLVPLAGKPTASRTADLAVCERDTNTWVQQRIAWAALAATPGAIIAALSATHVLDLIPTATSFLAVVAGGVGGWFYARVDLASDARTARREFRHTTAAYLELVTILMAGGAGVETAMFDAVTIGRGRAFRHLRAALISAQARREEPWRAFGQLGQRLGIPELEEFEASMTLAGGGAHVKDSLTAKASSMRAKDLAEAEATAQARSETMVLPVALMFAGFLLLIGYPALAGLSVT